MNRVVTDTVNTLASVEIIWAASLVGLLHPSLPSFYLVLLHLCPNKPHDSSYSNFILNITHNFHAFSALTLLVGQQEGHLACKNWVVGCWRGYLTGVRCRFAYGPDEPTATQCLLVQEINVGFSLPFWYQLTRVIPDKIQTAVKWMQCSSTHNITITLKRSNTLRVVIFS